MDNRSWINQDSPQGLRRMDYYNGIQGFFNYATSISRNISGGGIRCPYKRCKNKKVFLSKYCNDASSTQRVHGGILVLVCTRRIICSSQDHGRKNGWVNF